MGEKRYFNRGLGLKKVIGAQVAADYRSDLVERMRAEGYALEAGDLTFRLAREFGFCYGVDRAIDYAYETREKFPDRRIFLAGEIIHNPGVNRRLREMGVRFLAQEGEGLSYEEITEEDVVILPAFGVPTQDMKRLGDLNCIRVDTTCGSVLNVWKNVEKYAREGFTSLIHGKYWHEETRATASRALGHDGHYIVVLDMQETKVLCDCIEGKMEPRELMGRFSRAVSPGFDPEAHLERLGCANQTTMLSTESLAIAQEVRGAMIRRYGEERVAERFRAFDTICSATQDRQDALIEMLDEAPPDLVLVIGGYNSSNTGHLLEIAGRNVPAYHILNASCIESERLIRHQPVDAKRETRTEGWLPRGPVVVGLTAGASTPSSEVDAVVRRVASVRGVTFA